MDDFDAMAKDFTASVKYAADWQQNYFGASWRQNYSGASWRQNYFGAAYAPQIKTAIRDLKRAIADAEAHSEIGAVAALTDSTT
jgi:hypothetical protein